jgi:hypothetical protein
MHGQNLALADRSRASSHVLYLEPAMQKAK